MAGISPVSIGNQKSEVPAPSDQWKPTSKRWGTVSTVKEWGHRKKNRFKFGAFEAVKHVKLWEGKAVDGQKILRSARLEVAVQVRLLFC